ncbi:MAG: thioredoxin domain-containing protein [Alphaproteobacteria bacterium]
MNQLANETSPYLLQHADNPVDWQPWNSATLARAKAEDKPILLSIGYAACHWCHVMAHESFENEGIAALMNDLFVNIKVDREERPDLDTIYQSALAMLGEHGGWPLTMFCTPDGRPFWGGTYFPPEPRFGRPGFPHVLREIARIYHDEPDKVTSNATALLDALKRLSQPGEAGRLDMATFDKACELLSGQVDNVHGGLRGAPKFPQPSIFKLLWQGYKRSRSDALRHKTLLTLDKMAQGGIYDHLGGGFARYSVDDRWLVPHFEKMLYDNAQLLELYTHAWLETRKETYAERVRETVAWVLRDMINPNADSETGAFSATLDADSEGEEGRYYVWTAGEIDELLGADAGLFKSVYDVGSGGNWEGRTILNRIANPQSRDPETEARLARCRAILLDARTRRVLPALDDKILADWNGLMISALTVAAESFGEPAWLTAASDAFRFVTTRMHQDGRLMHTWRAGRLRHVATLDDYANLTRAALHLHEALGDPAYLAQAREWVTILATHYWDEEGGGYFFTANDATDVIARTKSAADHAVPAGNGTMVEVLARLYFATGEEDYRRRAEAVVAAFASPAASNVLSYATLLTAAVFLDSALQIVVVGHRGQDDTEALLRTVARVSLPTRVLSVVPPGQALPTGHPARGKGQIDGKATTYVCSGPVCSPPLSDVITLAAELARA